MIRPVALDGWPTRRTPSFVLDDVVACIARALHRLLRPVDRRPPVGTRPPSSRPAVGEIAEFIEQADPPLFTGIAAQPSPLFATRAPVDRPVPWYLDASGRTIVMREPSTCHCSSLRATVIAQAEEIDRYVAQLQRLGARPDPAPTLPPCGRMAV